MNISIISFIRNEEKMLPYFIEYYKKLTNNIIFYDNCSTDNSIEIINKYKCKVIQLNNIDKNYKEDFINNEIIKSNNKDTIFIILDCDEIIYHRYLYRLLYLFNKSNKKVIMTEGYNMILDGDFKSNNILDIKYGIRSVNHDKYCIIKTSSDNDFIVSGDLLKINNTEIVYNNYMPKMLHYKYIGGLDEILNKHQLYMNDDYMKNNIYNEHNTKLLYMYTLQNATKII